MAKRWYLWKSSVIISGWFLLGHGSDDVWEFVEIGMTILLQPALPHKDDGAGKEWNLCPNYQRSNGFNDGCWSMMGDVNE